MNVLDITLPEVPNHNDTLQALHQHVFTWMGQDFFLQYANEGLHPWVQIDFQMLGTSYQAYLSLNMVNTALAPLGLLLEDMSPDALHLWLLSSAPTMPANVQIKNLTIVAELPQDACLLDVYSYTTSQAMGWQMAVMPNTIPFASLIQLLPSYHKGMMPQPLANLPIAVPLVACAIDIPAHEIETLVVGDVLLLGGV